MLEVISKVLGVIAVALLLSLVLSIPVYYLWNWLMPVIFGLVKITFWQSVGISLLSSLLLKSNSSSSK